MKRDPVLQHPEQHDEIFKKTLHAKIETLPVFQWRDENFVNGIELSGVNVENPPEYIRKAMEESGDFMYESLNLESPILFTIGHNGTHVPLEEMKNHTAEGVECEASIDYGANHIIPEGFSFIGTKISRYVADPNRPQTTTRGTGTGGGTFWERSILNGKPVYSTVPTNERANELAEKFHSPYYSRIREIIDLIKEKHGFCILIDCHSFGIHELTKEYYSHYGIKDPSKELALFVLGSNIDPEVTPEQIALLQPSQFILLLEGELRDRFNSLPANSRDSLLRFSNQKISALNSPFSGGNIVNVFNDPDAYAIQIETNRGALTYTVEDDTYFSGEIASENTNNIRSILSQTLTNVSNIIKKSRAPKA